MLRPLLLAMAKILIADDSRVQVHLLSTSLAGHGFQVVVAVDALQAWMMALREAPNAIILDINMPGGSGIEVLRKLQLSSKTLHIPVVVISGSDGPDLKNVVLGMGAAEFLQKPIDPKQLCSIMIHLLQPPASIAVQPKSATASG